MKLEPVYLLGPEPEVPKVSRRMFLGAVVGAAALGTTAGFWAASGGADAPQRPPIPVEQPPLLRWAIDLAEDGREALLPHAPTFLLVFARHHEAAELLWPGVEELAVAALDSSDDAGSELAELILQHTAGRRESPVFARLRPRLERKVR